MFRINWIDEMDATTREMIMTAYDDTYSDACAQGHNHARAHTEALIAAAMCLAAIMGVEDTEAHNQIAALNLGKS